VNRKPGGGIGEESHAPPYPDFPNGGAPTMFKYEINGITRQMGAIRTGHSSFWMDRFLSNNLEAKRGQI